MNNKEAYVQKMQAKLDEWDADLDKMKAKMSGTGADAKIKFNEQINSLESQCDEMKQQLVALEGAGEEAWEDIRNGFEASWDKLSNAFKDAANKFK